MRKLRPLIFLLLLGFGLLLFRATVLRGQVYFWHDASLQNQPFLKAAAEAWDRGQLPLWVPDLGGGFPLLAQGEAAALYPLRLLLLATGMPYYQAYSWIVLVQCVLAALGCALLGRKLGLGYLAATCAGLAFGFSGYLVSKALFLSVMQSLPWLPWVLLCLIAGVESGVWGWFIGAAAAFALAIYGGHPQMVFYIAVASALVLLWLLLAPGRVGRGRRFARTALGGGGALVLGAALAAAQLVPTFTFFQFTAIRTSSSTEFLRELALHPRNLVYFLHPYLFGSYGHNDYWGQDHYYEVCAYVGGITVLLAAVGLLLRRGPLRYRGLWALLAVVGVSMALADLNPLYRLLPSVPGLNLFRAPARYLILTDLGLALLAGGAVQALGTARRREAGKALAVGALAALLGGGAVVGVLHGAKPKIVRALAAREPITAGESKAEEKWQDLAERLSLRDPVWLALLGGFALAGIAGLMIQRDRLPYPAAGGVMVAVLGTQLFLFGDQANGHAPPSYYTHPPRTAQLFHRDRTWGREYTDPRLERASLIPPEYPGYLSGDLQPYLAEREVLRRNRAVLWNVPSAFTYCSLMPQRETDLLGHLVPAGLAGDPSGARAPVQVLRMLGVRAFLGLPGMHSPWLQLMEQAPQYAYYRVAMPMPRAWLPRRVVACGSEGEVRARLCEPQFLPEETALVEGVSQAKLDRWLGTGPAASWLSLLGRVRLIRDEATSLTWEVQPPTPSFLVLNMSYNPNWRAKVNGREAGLYRANYLQCGVLVPAGKSRVEVEYVPEDLYLGVQISAVAATAAGAGLVLALVGWGVRRRRQEVKADSA